MADGTGMILSVAPELPTNDLDETKGWYERHLGFREAGRWREQDFLILERDGFPIHFRRVPGTRGPQAGNVYIRLRSGVDEVALRMAAAGASTAHGPEDKDWGMREFVAYDPDGRAVRIGEPLGVMR